MIRLRRLAIVSFFWPTAAFAQFGSPSIQNCDEYVSRTSSQVQMAAGCPVSGARWSANPADHKAWCKDASEKERDREYDERSKALVGCRGDSGAVAVSSCHDYTARFLSQLDLAKALRSSCAFEGMRWSANLVQHLHWCNRTDAGRHEAEDAARRKELADCKAK